MTSSGTRDAESRRGGIPCVIAAALLLVLALWVAAQFIGVLYALIAPPAPPLPADLTLRVHEAPAYGRDSWVYSSEASACSLIQFYRAAEGECAVTPPWCADGDTPSPGIPQLVGECAGSARFSIFTMGWSVQVRSGAAMGRSELRLQREIFWSGAPVQPRPNP